MRKKSVLFGKVKRTCRGFQIIEFKDYYDKPCSIQSSSIIIDRYDDAFEKPGTSALWIGQGEERMHLDRESACILAKIINCWLRSGTLANDEDLLEM